MVASSKDADTPPEGDAVEPAKPKPKKLIGPREGLKRDWSKVNRGARGRNKYIRRTPVETVQAKAAFLKAIGSGMSVTASCEAAKLSSHTISEWREKDKAFDEAYKAAYEEGTDRLEDAAWQRAVHGTQDNVYQGGELVGHRLIISDNLMIRMLAARRPALYRQQFEHVGAAGGPIKVDDVTDLELARRIAFMLTKGTAAAGRIEAKPVPVPLALALESSSSSTT